jgi:hypothetical protein
MHRISDDHLHNTQAPINNLRMFKGACGKMAFERVRLVTAFWGYVRQRRQDVAEARERSELQSKIWESMLDKGSTMSRFMKSSESIWEILEPLLANPQEVFLNGLVKESAGKKQPAGKRNTLASLFRCACLPLVNS